MRVQTMLPRHHVPRIWTHLGHTLISSITTIKRMREQFFTHSHFHSVSVPILYYKAIITLLLLVFKLITGTGIHI